MANILLLVFRFICFPLSLALSRKGRGNKKTKKQETELRLMGIVRVSLLLTFQWLT
jgi:hypothetical protein